MIIKSRYGTIRGHLFVLFLTWWTFGIGNLAYLGINALAYSEERGEWKPTVQRGGGGEN